MNIRNLRKVLFEPRTQRANVVSIRPSDGTMRVATKEGVKKVAQVQGARVGEPVLLVDGTPVRVVDKNIQTFEV